MKISHAYASAFAAFAVLFTASSAAAQERARFMVYHAEARPTPNQPAPEKQPSAVARPQIAERSVATTSVTVVKQAQPANRVTAIDKQVTATDKPITAVQVARVERRNSPESTKSSYIAPLSTTPVMPTSVTTVPVATSAPAPVAAKSPVTKTAAVAPRMESPREASARKPFDRWFVISSAVFAVGAVMDHQSTVAGMNKVGAREANPLLRNSDGGFSPGKHLALSAGMYGASLMLQKKHPRMANILRLVGGFAKIGVSMHNRRAAAGRPDALPQ